MKWAKKSVYKKSTPWGWQGSLYRWVRVYCHIQLFVFLSLRTLITLPYWLNTRMPEPATQNKPSDWAIHELNSTSFSVPSVATFSRGSRSHWDNRWQNRPLLCISARKSGVFLPAWFELLILLVFEVGATAQPVNNIAIITKNIFFIFLFKP